MEGGGPDGGAAAGGDVGDRGARVGGGVADGGVVGRSTTGWPRSTATPLRLLESTGMDGTFYVASNWVKTNDAKYMRFYQLDELYRQGNEIGGMGKDHKNLTTHLRPRPGGRPRLQARPGVRRLPGADRLGLPPGELRLPRRRRRTRRCRGSSATAASPTGPRGGRLSATGPVYAEPVPPANPLRLRAATTPGRAADPADAAERRDRRRQRTAAAGCRSPSTTCAAPGRRRLLHVHEPATSPIDAAVLRAVPRLARTAGGRRASPCGPSAR